jgi:hypothetical protein
MKSTTVATIKVRPDAAMIEWMKAVREWRAAMERAEKATAKAARLQAIAVEAHLKVKKLEGR